MLTLGQHRGMLSGGVEIVTPPAALVFTQQPSGAVVGSAFQNQPIVRVNDAEGAILTSYTGPVEIELVEPADGALSSPTLSQVGGNYYVNAVAGIATFPDLEVDTSGNYVLLASIPAYSLEEESAEFAATTLIPRAFWSFGNPYTDALFTDKTGRGNDLEPFLRFGQCTTTFRMGRNSAPVFGVANPQQLFGALWGWGVWHRMLTSGEKAALAGGEVWPFTTTPTLQDAKAFFVLSEAGGSITYVDATGRGNDLTATGTTTTTPAPHGGGTAPVFTTGVYLSKVSPGDDLQSGPRNTTICGWARIDDKPAGTTKQQVFWGNLNNDEDPTPESGFNVYFDPTSNRHLVDLNAGDGRVLGQGHAVMANNFGAPALAAWHHIISEFHYDGNASYIAVDNGTRDSLTDVLQPIPIAAKIGNGSFFKVNPALSFASRISGWDAPPVVNGNCHVKMLPTADTQIGNNAKTVWGWFRVTTGTVTTQTLAGYFTGTANCDWLIQVSGNLLYFVFGSASKFVTVPFTDTASGHLVFAWFDKVANKIKINLDNGAQAAEVGTISPALFATHCRFASDGRTAGGHQMEGWLNAWGIADGIPTADDIAALWNAGAGGRLYQPT
jgi:hypothetical protein